MISAAQRSLRDWLADIVEWGGAVQHYVAGTDADALRRDKMRLHALAKCVESIGEASSQLELMEAVVFMLLDDAPDLAGMVEDWRNWVRNRPCCRKGRGWTRRMHS